MRGLCLIRRQSRAEPALQRLFSILTFAIAVVLAAAIINFAELYRDIPDRVPMPPREVPIRIEPVALDPAGFAPLKLAGAWRMRAPDPRFGGASALAVDGGRLLALSDSGVLSRFPKPGTDRPLVGIEELPAGPGPPGFKRNRDSESLLRDWRGRGWWVGFENRNRVWLFDAGFRAVVSRYRIARGWPRTGFEAMVEDRGELLLVPECGHESACGRRSLGSSRMALDSGRPGVRTPALLPDGSLLLVQRGLDVTGYANRLVQVRRDGAGYASVRSIPLGVERRDNVEGMAVEPRPGGALRLWLITDDGRGEWPQRTLLVALDWPAALAGGSAS